jgi:hypothetical protein
MAGVVTSGSFAKALWPGVNKFYQQDYEDWSTEYTEFCDAESSKKQFEEDVGVSQFGLAGVKPEGQGIDYDDTEQNFISRYVHKVYAKGFIVTREMVDDDLYGVVSRRQARSLARSLRLTKETVHANIVNNGFTSSFTMGSDHDGVELFSSLHPFGPYGGTYANELGTPADLSEASLEDMMIIIAQAKDARGLQMQLHAQKMVVPPQLMFIASRILDSELRSGTSDNDVNALKHGNYLPGGFVVNHYLTDTDAWFLKTNCPDGLKTFERRGQQFETDNEFDTENAKFKATERYSVGWSDPRGMYSSEGAA